MMDWAAIKGTRDGDGAEAEAVAEAEAEVVAEADIIIDMKKWVG